jgi:hypothetical protein
VGWFDGERCGLRLSGWRRTCRLFWHGFHNFLLPGRLSFRPGGILLLNLAKRLSQLVGRARIHVEKWASLSDFRQNQCPPASSQGR